MSITPIDLRDLTLLAGFIVIAGLIWTTVLQQHHIDDLQRTFEQQTKVIAVYDTLAQACYRHTVQVDSLQATIYQLMRGE